jgi:hypothetical protein
VRLGGVEERLEVGAAAVGAEDSRVSGWIWLSGTTRSALLATQAMQIESSVELTVSQ